MKSIYLLLVALIFLGCNSAKFNIMSTSTCTSTSAAGFCTKWEQNGTVEQQTAACFAGTMIVLTKDGYKALDELQIGDHILSYDRNLGQVYTRVRGWFHRDSEASVNYLKVTFQNAQQLLVSQKHNIAFPQEAQAFRYQFAEQITKQDALFGSLKTVNNIEITKQKGMYAPMTYNSNYFVFTSKQHGRQRILAHDYANIRNPESYQPIGNIIFSGYQYFKGKEQQVGVHPAAKWLMQKFDFLLQ